MHLKILDREASGINTIELLRYILISYKQCKTN